MLLVFFLSLNSVRIGQNLLNEVLVESSIPTDFANYHILIVLMEILMGPGRIICMGSYGPQKVDNKRLGTCVTLVVCWAK